MLLIIILSVCYSYILLPYVITMKYQAAIRCLLAVVIWGDVLGGVLSG